MRTVSFAGVVLTALAPLRPPLAAGAEFDASHREAVIERLIERLLADYVFPEKAEAMRDAIHGRVAAGEYDEVTSGGRLAELLTEHLQDVCHDRHLRVRYSPEPLPEPPSGRGPGPAERERMLAEARRRNFGFERVEHLPGNIGYLKLDGFVRAEIGAETASAAMNFLAHCDAIIIDLRENGGGDPDMVAHISSYLFGDEPVHLNSLYFRPENHTNDFYTNPGVPGVRNPSADVYVLTSHYTFSAAEEFTYNLQCLKRATIVGETTGGGAHPGGTQRIDDHFMVFIPTGRAINPITQTNWEGVGVVPEVSVPADQAYHQALLTAMEKAMARVESPRERDALRAAMREANRELADLELASDESDG